MVNGKLIGLVFSIVAVGLIVFLLHFYGASLAENNIDTFEQETASSRGMASRAATYVGSETCNGCHPSTYTTWNTTVHARMLVNRTDAEAAGMPLPEGMTWDDITYVIGQKWKVRYVNVTGHILTSNGSGPGGNMWDVADQTWEDYHAGELLNYTCGNCHTTGYNASDSIPGLPGIDGNWSETGVGCEACHGPGSEHAGAPSKTNIQKDSTSELCGQCHQRPVNGNITEINPDRSHHEQYNDWYNSKHQESNIDCITCHDPHDTSDALYATYTNYTVVKPAKVKFLSAGSYVSVADSQDLCGKCHTTLESGLDHGNGTVDATCVDCHMSLSRVTINKWDLRSHSFKVDDGIDYDASADLHTSNFPFFTCEQSSCHTGGISHFDDWNDSAHADTNHGYNSNTYCGHCMSPFQGDPAATNSTLSSPVSMQNWTGINCAVCHDLHSDPGGLAFFNGTSGQRDAPVTNPADLCGQCHQGHHPQKEKWTASAHANTYHAGADDNTYCAKCMSPFQSDPAATHDTNDPVAQADWWGITCTVCHDQHTLELALFNGTDREAPIDDPSDLCGGCHGHSQYGEWEESAHADTYHPGESDNTYCAHCMSPFQFEEDYNETIKTNRSMSKTIAEDDWDSIGCIVCHDQHSLELALFNGTDREAPVKNPADLCGGCHSGHHTQYDDWVESGHADTYNEDENDNTYCAHCMSPFQYDEDATHDENDPVSEADWDGITCMVCHNPHSLELEYFNGTGYEEVTTTSDLCGKCHSGHHTQLEEWNESAHAHTNHGYNDNTYCAHCMSPLQGDPDATSDNNKPVGKDNWTSIECIVCHNKHTLELEFFNGSAYETDIDQPADLCGKCHSGHHTQLEDWEEGAHSKTNHGYNNNTYCAHCMSPLQGDPEATSDNNKPISTDDWMSIDCIVCHNKHTLELEFFNGSAYETDIEQPADLCGKCHSGHHTQLEEWEEGAHSKTNHGYNNNTYCAHCMSPLQGDPEATSDNNKLISTDDWMSIDCIVCHNKHSLELEFYNGSAYETDIEKPADLCGKCHSGHHGQFEDWSKGAHSDTYSTSKNNTYCAQCHSPIQADIEATSSDREGIDEDDWYSIDCIVCHNKHSLELSVYNGSAYVDVDEDPNELCAQCHKANGDTPGHVDDIHTQWEESAHFDTWKGFNDNTECAHCMSPYQGDPTVEDSSDGVPVGMENWTSIGCIVCHDKHTLELRLYNGSAYEDVEDTRELCGSCHTMEDAVLGDEPHHSTLEMRTGVGAIGITQKVYMVNQVCGDCHAYDSDHSFHPDDAACVDCHSNYNTDAEAEAAIEEIQNNTQALLDITEVNLTLAEKAMSSAEENGTWSAEMNTSYYTALFNYEYVIADGSTGFHNPDYVEDILKDANDRAVDIVDEVGLLPSISVTPADGSTDVPVNTLITVQFEEDINFTDLKTNGYLAISGGISGALSYDSSTFTVTYTPSSDLPYDTLITATLSNKVKMADGSIFMNKDYSWSFRTVKEITDMTIVIGPILDENDDPVSGAKVTVTIDGKEYSGTTNDNGLATITVPAADFAAGKANVKVTKDDFDDLKFSVDIDNNGTAAPPSGGIPSMKESAGESNILMILIIIIIVIVVVVVLLMVMRKKKPEEEEPMEEEEEEAMGEDFECPKCSAVVASGEEICPECGTEFDEDMMAEGEEDTEAGEDDLEDEEAEEADETDEESEDEDVEYEEEESDEIEDEVEGEELEADEESEEIEEGDEGEAGEELLEDEEELDAETEEEDL